MSAPPPQGPGSYPASWTFAICGGSLWRSPVQEVKTQQVSNAQQLTLWLPQLWRLCLCVVVAIVWLLRSPQSWRLYGHLAVAVLAVVEFVVIMVHGCYASEVTALGVIVVMWLLQVFWLLRPYSLRRGPAPGERCPPDPSHHRQC